MCGIVGVFPLQSSTTVISPELQRALAFWFHNELLYHTVKRGKDSTGLVATFGPHADQEKHPNPNFWACLKQPVDVDDFFSNNGTDKKYTGQKKNANVHTLMDKFSALERPLLHLIGHTRYKTLGSELNPNNNHPIIVGNTIGVHNGGVKNHKKIYEKHPAMKPIGEVDSEAIMQLLSECAPDRAFNIDDAAYVTERIEGPRAVMAFNNKNPESVIFFRDTDRPMEISYLDRIGLMVIYSERDFLKTTFKSYERMMLLYGKTMPGSETLPEIDEVTGHISSGEGGVININKVFDKGTVREFTELKKLPDTLDDYKNVTTTNTIYKDNKSTTTHGHHHTTSVGAASSTPEAKIVEAEAELHDLSDYSDKKGAADDSITIDTKEFMDDPGVVDQAVDATLSLLGDEATEETTETLIVDSPDEEEDEEYGTNHLRELAEGEYFNENFQNDPRVVFNRMKGKLASLLNIPQVDEDAALEAISFIYPELFSDGYIYGYALAENNALEAADDDAVEASELAKENADLREKLELSDKQLKKATKHMANLKAFLLASFMVKDLIDVDSKTDSVVFDDDIEDFMEMGGKFKSVSIENVRKLFSVKERRMVSEGITAQARGKNKTRTMA